MNWKAKVMAYLIAYSAKAAMWLLLLTCRFKLHGLQQFLDFASKNKCILMLWHNRLAVTPTVLTRYTSNLTFNAMVSNSRDGEPLAILVNSYSIGKTIRVPHDARFKALQTAIAKLKYSNDILVITPDGPRGPRYKVKAGVATAARLSGAHVIPLTWTASRFWQFNTWDQFMLPKPFSTIDVRMGSPINIPDDPNTDVSHDIAILEKALNVLTNEKDKRQ